MQNLFWGDMGRGRQKVEDISRNLQLAKKAALNKGHSLVCKKSGGGSDANIFAGKGILTGVLGTGMRDMHTVRESIRLDDMVKSAELVLEIIRVHAQGA